MPRIINAYADGNSSIADSLSKLGEAIYGDQAKNEVYRQKAFGAKRENDNMEPFAAALRDNNAKEALYRGVLSGSTGQNFGDYNRARAAVHSGGNVDSPDLATSFMGAGGSFSGTAPGQSRALANDRTTTGMNNATTLAAEDMRSKRAADTQLVIDNRTLAPVDDGNGGYRYELKSNAVGQGAPVSMDQTIANMLRKQAAAQQPGQTTGDPFAGVDPRIMKKAGLDLPEQSLVNPADNRTAISRDGGRTAILPDGSSIPATGFQPVGQDAALNEARGNVQRKAAAEPLAVGNPVTSQAAADAAQTSGLGAKLAKVTNEEFGAIPGVPAILNAVNSSPEISAETQRAQSRQDIRNNQARTVLLGGPGRQTVQAQRWVNELLPQGDAFANPATEAAKIPTIINALKGDHEQYRQIVLTTADPAERAKAMQSMHQIENTIRMYTDPAAAAPPAAPVAPTAPGGAQAATGGDPLSQARAAIAKGADPAAVKQRLQQNGINPAGL